MRLKSGRKFIDDNAAALDPSQSTPPWAGTAVAVLYGATAKAMFAFSGKVLVRSPRTHGSFNGDVYADDC